MLRLSAVGVENGKGWVIGDVIGNGEVLCFSQLNGEKGGGGMLAQAVDFKKTNQDHVQLRKISLIPKGF
jgi:hypothetical protein